MIKPTILRTAAGAPVAPSVIKAIKEAIDVNLVVTDISSMSSGFHFADQHEIVPRVDNPGYLQSIFDLCKKHSVNIFWPDLDEELLLMAENKSEFEKMGVRLLLSDADTLRICGDKYFTFEALKGFGVPVPESFITTEDAVGNLSFPMLLKPRQGRGSVGVTIINNHAELQDAFNSIENPIIQEFLPGKEYTIDALSDMDGKFHYCSIRQRVSTDSGISVKGETVSDKKLEAFVESACNELKLKGPSCFQCKEDPNGVFKFIEINPRIAGTSILSEKAGAHVITDSVRVAMGDEPKGNANFKAGFKMTRYWSEIFEG